MLVTFDIVHIRIIPTCNQFMVATIWIIFIRIRHVLSQKMIFAVLDM